MPPTVKPRAFVRFLSFLLALAPAGCGLADYEKKMQETDARLQRFDERKVRFADESKLLGDPLDLPTDEKTAPPVSLFLRPPKGIAKTAGPEKISNLPYAYHATAAAPATPPACTDVYLLFLARDADAKDLKTGVEVWLKGTGAWQPYTTQPATGRDKTTFDAATFNDPQAPGSATCRVFVRQATNGAPVAVVYRLPQPASKEAEDAVNMSLETYADSEEAHKAKSEFEFWLNASK